VRIELIEDEIASRGISVQWVIWEQTHTHGALARLVMLRR